METELNYPTSRVLTAGVLARAALAEEDYERATGLPHDDRAGRVAVEAASMKWLLLVWRS